MFNREMQERLMAIAMEETNKAIDEGNGPFGAVLVDEHGNIIERAHNICNTSVDPTAHAEITLIRNACKKLKTRDLSSYIMFCNGESCSMCMTAIIKAKIKTIYYGAEMENDANPYVRAFEIINKAKDNVQLINICKEECTKQLLEARKNKK
jgi:tRNA(Arg) A34 adenosine deaminase TadA